MDKQAVMMFLREYTTLCLRYGIMTDTYGGEHKLVVSFASPKSLQANIDHMLEQFAADQQAEKDAIAEWEKQFTVVNNEETSDEMPSEADSTPNKNSEPEI